VFIRVDRIELATAKVTEVLLAFGACHVVTSHRFLHMNVTTGTRLRALLQPFSVRPVFFVLHYQSFQVLLSVAPLHRFSSRRPFRRVLIFDDEALCNLDRAI